MNPRTLVIAMALAATGFASAQTTKVFEKVRITDNLNLNTITNKVALRDSLGLEIGSDIQAYSLDLTNFVNAAEWDGFELTLSSVGLVLDQVEAVNFNGGGAGLFDLNATQLTSGTIPDSRFPAALPAISGQNLTSLSASNIGTGTLSNLRLDADLAALGDNSTSGFLARTGAGTAAARSLAATAPGFSWTNSNGVSGDPSLAYSNVSIGTTAVSSSANTLQLTVNGARVRQSFQCSELNENTTLSWIGSTPWPSQEGSLFIRNDASGGYNLTSMYGASLPINQSASEATLIEWFSDGNFIVWKIFHSGGLSCVIESMGGG